MKKEYTIDFAQVTVMDGDDMLEALAVMQGGVLSDSGISVIDDDGVNITVSRETILSLYRYCVNVNNVETGRSAYYFMCANECPSGIEDSAKKHLIFAPGRYTGIVFGNTNPPNLWNASSLVDALLSFECKYGDKDSYYNVMERISEANMLYGVSTKDNELKKYKLFNESKSPFFFSASSDGIIKVGAKISNVDKPVFNNYIYFDKVVGDEIFTNVNLAPTHNFQTTRKSDDGSVFNMLFLTESAANAELVRFRDEIIENMTERLKSIRGEWQKLMVKINTLRNL